jgi:hypothetical protein
MNQVDRSMANDKRPVLEEFYKRIAAVVEYEGGSSTAVNARRTITVQTATPKVEGVPALLAKMPNDFEVEFAPTDALGIGNVINVRATRRHRGLVKDSIYVFTFATDGVWKYASRPVADGDIKACLTLAGPPLR